MSYSCTREFEQFAYFCNGIRNSSTIYQTINIAVRPSIIAAIYHAINTAVRLSIIRSIYLFCSFYFVKTFSPTFDLTCTVQIILIFSEANIKHIITAIHYIWSAASLRLSHQLLQVNPRYYMHRWNRPGLLNHLFWCMFPLANRWRRSMPPWWWWWWWSPTTYSVEKIFIVH